MILSRSRTWRLCALLLVAVAFLATEVAAAANTGILRGRVIDGQTGNSIPRAQLRLSAFGMSAIADDVGVYNFTGVPSGSTTLIASAPGYKESVLNIEVFGGVQSMDVVLVPLAQPAAPPVSPAPAVQQPVVQQPVYQAPVYQAPVYQAPSYQSPQASTAGGLQYQKVGWLNFGGGLFIGDRTRSIENENNDKLASAVAGLQYQSELRFGQVAVQVDGLSGEISDLKSGNYSYQVDGGNVGSTAVLAKLILPVIPGLELALLGGFEQTEYGYNRKSVTHYLYYNDSVYTSTAREEFKRITKGLTFGGELTLRPSPKAKLSGDIRYSPALNTTMEYQYRFGSSYQFWDRMAYDPYSTSTLTWRARLEIALLPAFRLHAGYINSINVTPEDTKTQRRYSTNAGVLVIGDSITVYQLPSTYTWSPVSTTLYEAKDTGNTVYFGASLQF